MSAQAALTLPGTSEPNDGSLGPRDLRQSLIFGAVNSWFAGTVVLQLRWQLAAASLEQLGGFPVTQMGWAFRPKTNVVTPKPSTGCEVDRRS